MDRHETDLPVLSPQREPEDLPAFAGGNRVAAVAADVSRAVASAAVAQFDTADVSVAVERRQEAIGKQLEAENIEAEAAAQIRGIKAETAIEQAVTESDVTGTLSKAEREKAYYTRHADTLARYGIRAPCSAAKMRVLVCVDLFATIIAAPLLFLFRLATMLVEGFAGLTKAVQKIIIFVIIAGAIFGLIGWLVASGFLKFG